MGSGQSGSASIDVNVSADTFFSLITNYLNYPIIIKEVKEAKILSHPTQHEAIVAFQIRVFMKGFDYTLHFVADPPRQLNWTLHHSDTLEENNGGWTLEPLCDNSVRVTYFNTLRSKGFLPDSILNALVKVSLPKMLKTWKKAAESKDS